MTYDEQIEILKTSVNDSVAEIKRLEAERDARLAAFYNAFQQSQGLTSMFESRDTRTAKAIRDGLAAVDAYDAKNRQATEDRKLVEEDRKLAQQKINIQGMRRS